MNRFKFLACLLLWLVSYGAMSNEAISNELTAEHKNWLKEKFSAQHEKLIPIVAVADMYFACNKERKVHKDMLEVKELILNVDKNELANNLSLCLKDDLPNSETALNFGLIGCFHEQLKELAEKDRIVKEKLVLQAIQSLSEEERKKSFTQCVTDQAIGYLK